MSKREFSLLEEAHDIRKYISELEILVNAGKNHIKDHLDVFNTRELRCMHSDHLLTQEEYDNAILKVAKKGEEKQ